MLFLKGSRSSLTIGGKFFTASAVALAGVLLTFLLANPVQAQNKINTIAGGGTVNPNPLSDDIPGPTAVVEDASGNLYIAPPNSQYILEWQASTGQMIVFAGTGYISDHHQPGIATTSPLWSPSALAIDSHGNVYIADTGNNAIKEVSPSGELTTIVGTTKPCGGGKCGDNGPAILAQLNGPSGVALDSSGNIYVADTNDNRVRCVIMVAEGCGSGSAVGDIVNYVGTVGAACPSSTSACGDGGKANVSLLNNPIGVSVASNGYLYIADNQDNRIREVGAQRIITTIAGTGNLCAPSTAACGDGGAATSANLGFPRGVWVDSLNNVYIADNRSQRLRLVTHKTNIITTLAGTGVKGFAGDGGEPVNAELSSPAGVFVDASGNVFVADTGNQRIRKITGGSTGVISTIIGGGSGGDGGAPNGTYALLSNPYAVAVDSSNNYYIADTSDNRIRVVNTQPGPITVASVLIPAGTIATVAGSGNAGYTGDGGAALSATFNSPYGIAVDGSGNIYVADSLNHVVREVNGATGTINTFAPSANWITPTAVAVDAQRNVFVADAAGNQIYEVSGGVATVVAGNGTPGYLGDGSPATLAELDDPFGVAVDTSDDIYIADSQNDVIRCVLGAIGGCGDSGHKYAVGDIITYAYTGGATFSGDGGLAVNASRSNPTEVAVDAAGNLFVGGGDDYLVQRVDLATGIIVTVVGIDTEPYFYGFFGDGYAAVKSHINATGLTIDGNENLLIADTGNNRIQEVPMVPATTMSPTSLTFPNTTIGQTSAPMTVTVQNTGANDLSFTSIVATTHYTQTNNCPISPASLAPSQSCTITVTFSPTTTNTVHGKITLTDNGYGSPQGISLTGTGVEP